MAVLTFEGIVEAGQIRLLNGEQLPDQTTVYVVVPHHQEEQGPKYTVTIPANPHIRSPRLVNRADAQRFQMVMTEDAHAGV